jgi:hypothetical protein
MVDPDYLIMEHDPDRLRAYARGLLHQLRNPSRNYSFEMVKAATGMARRRLCRRPSSAGTGDGWAHCRGGEVESASQLIQVDPGEK